MTGGNPGPSGSRFAPVITQDSAQSNPAALNRRHELLGNCRYENDASIQPPARSATRGRLPRQSMRS